MAADRVQLERRNLPILTGQSTFAQMAWTMGSPSIVLTFLAVSLELPMFLAGALIAIRQAAGTIADVFLAGPIAAKQRKKQSIALTDFALAACLVLAVAAAVTGIKPLVMAAFVLAFFLIGLIEEVQSLLLTDLISDHLRSSARARMQYAQMGLGGLGAIGLTLAAHTLMKDNPPFARHLVVVTIAIACFVFSACSMLALRELVAISDRSNPPGHSPLRLLKEFLARARFMFRQAWFRKYMALRLIFVIVALAVPFFALIAAEAHHDSDRGLTALIVSSATGYLVAAPLWHMLDRFSHRMVMLTGAFMVTATGVVLIAFHFLGWDHEIHLHAISLFVVTVAVTGLSTTRKLYFMDVAPKDQRVEGVAVAKSVSRIAVVVISTILAAVAHTQEVVWAIVVITLASLVAAAVSYVIVKPQQPQSEASA